MNRDSWADVLLVRACEEIDTDGVLLSARERDHATRETAHAEDAEVERLVARASRLMPFLDERAPSLVSASRTVSSLTLPAWLPTLAFLLGVLTDRLGNTRELNLLAFPLLGLLAWNALAYGGEALRALGVAGALPDLVPLLRRLRKLASPLARLAGAERARELAILERLGVLAHASTGAREGLAVRRSLHLGAVAFALGVVASLYGAGLAFAYEATWESTFLDAGGVHRVLGLLLGPASALLGLPLPEVAEIAAIEAPGRTDAAPWIHRWAATVGLFVVVPRLLLAIGAGLRARRTGVELDLEEAYYVRLLAAARGGGRSVDGFAYSFEPDPAVRDQLQDLALELFGNRIRLEPLAPLRYGDPAPPAPEGEAAGRILVFNLAQSPEQEVHGAFVATCLRALGAGEARLLVALDESGYRRNASPERVDERRRSWSRVLREEHVVPIWLPGAPQETLAAAREALDARTGDAAA